MSSSINLSKLKVEDFAERFSSEMIPITNHFSYFSAVPLNEDEARELLEEPVSALPPEVQSRLPDVSIILVPYLERSNGKEGGEQVSFEEPPPQKQAPSCQLARDGRAILTFGIKGQETADYHYSLYYAVAGLACQKLDPESEGRYASMLREELSNHVHGEVDERSWRLKQGLLRKQSNVRRDTKGFREYARASLTDTLTLYLHGICCDIDVETGPRQLPSRYLRKRLTLLQELFPPPSGYAVFPEDLNKD
jgi:hypothetical protein